MLSKGVLKDIQRLGLKKGRAETGLFLAEGPKVVGELLEAVPQQVEGVYALPQWIEGHRALVEPHQLHEVTGAELERISQLQTPNAVLLVARQWEGERPGIAEGWILYLDTIQDPGNLGTILRIADWFGIKNVVCSAGCAERFNPKVVQSTMASLARVNVWYDEAGDWLQEQEAPVLAAALDGVSLYEFEAPKSGILLIGNESKGLHPELLQLATQKITIPRIGGAESLNAAVATGIIVSHLIAKRAK
ncbi:RNA methyltransferase [Flaviaesturariibacter aridisoli]|uniref:RNA methyltransferase n=1 Tax=Flaviaesturariibacter aridisoli TaxID=2545761 RepID=A0A4R4E315_9BACT|nr:RNA methyltransferase [Flaviaesturariibacter aridisoli]TCZ73307.1 RNA methyltransferase [Flaviaesturariibacter aridisoli]